MTSWQRARIFYGSGMVDADNAVDLLAAEFDEVRRLALKEVERPTESSRLDTGESGELYEWDDGILEK